MFQKKFVVRFVVVQGGNERLARSFCDTVIATYQSGDATSVISGLTNGMRLAIHAVAVGARAKEPVGSLGATAAVVVQDEIYLAQVVPSQVYILRDSTLNILPD